MNTEIPFFNFSLRKLLGSERDSFKRAKIRILFTILIFSILKVLIVLGIGIANHQDFQSGRALFLLLVYIVLLKLLLAKKTYVSGITHTMLCLGLMIIWSTVFLSAQAVNLVVVQFVFMVFVSSFYLLGLRMGLIYSTLTALPVIIFLLLHQDGKADVPVYSQELAAPGPLILILLNFLTVILAHYLYHQAFSENLKEKTSLNTQLKIAAREANELARTKSDFLSVMSHELRTPLNSVIGMSELLLDEPASEQQKDNLKVLRFSALSLHTLINDILDFNKLDSNKIELEAIPVNLDELVGNICSGLELQASEKGLKLICETDPAIRKLSVISDPTRLSQIIYNLLGNGIKFTTHGFVKISLKKLAHNDSMLRVLFKVEDSGIGISPEKQQLIFEPFIQASSTTTRNFGGTGLGLSIVKRLLHLFGSDVYLQSGEDQGSIFSFEIEFPVDKEIADEKKERQELNTSLSDLRVLIAEDNPMNIFLVRKLCNKWNIEPEFAENGREALDKLQQQDFDLILMDIHMPQMNGFEATRIIRSLEDPKKASVYIIAITASVSENMEKRTRDAGMNDSISKPFDHRELYMKLLKVRQFSREKV